MTPSDFRATLSRLGLSQGRAAKLLGVTPRTAERWAAGTVPIPHAVAMLLALCAEKPSVWELVRGQEDKNA